jgi:hypothetical protein
MYPHAEWMLETIKKSNGKIQKIAEIGVFVGYLTRQILKYTPRSLISEYWAIDPWKSITTGFGWHRHGNLERQWIRRYMYVCKFMRYFPELHVVRAPSVEASKLFPKEYFDLVFIDGDHTYKAVMQDIEAWLPLVKSEGILSGHDYANIKNMTEVKKAVDKTFGDNVEIIPVPKKHEKPGKKKGLSTTWVYYKK